MDYTDFPFRPVNGAAMFKADMIPVAVAREKRKQTRLATDEEGTQEVHERSKGQCEVTWFGKRAKRVIRCQRPRMIGVHHMIGGHGKRGRGISALAIHKQDVCSECHRLITSHVLRRVGDEVPLWTDEYERVDR